MNWFAVETRPQRESWVNDGLERCGFETWFPFSKEWVPSEKSKLRSELARVAFFPRYLFVLSTWDRLHRVTAIEWVTRILCSPGGAPAIIPVSLMEDLWKEFGRSGKVYRNPSPKPGFSGRVGQQFRFGEKSQLFGLYATIARVVSNERILAKLHFSLCGQDSIEVPVSDVGHLLPMANAR